MNTNEKKEKLYLDEALLEYSRSDAYPFHMPGHKRQNMGSWRPEDIDITEITGFDNLHHAEGILRDAMRRAAETFGADESFYLVNGSTAGLLSAVCACVKRGGHLLMARNCHKAVYHAAYLMELKTSYLYPERTDFGIQGSISPKQVADALEKNPDAAAVLLTTPTYDGVVSDIAAIADLVHKRGIPLIIDEAHGAHFGFGGGFPEKAIRLGADLCIESLHKTLPSYTQTALLHYRKNPWVDPERVKRYLGIFQSSSPSYVLMAGMDRCTRMLREHGTELFSAYEDRLCDFYRKCENLERVHVFPMQSSDAGIWARDASKILIDAEEAGLHGQELADLLANRYHLELEMASGHYATALTSIMDTQEGFDRLYAALQEIDAAGSGKSLLKGYSVTEKNHSEYKPDAEKCDSENALTFHREGSLQKRKSTGNREQVCLTTNEIYRPMKKAAEIAEAMNAPGKSLPIGETAGCVCREFVYLYPPGIPILTPGEVITQEVLDVIALCSERNMQVQGMKDYSGQNLEICTIL